MREPILAIENLSMHLTLDGQRLTPVDEIALTINKGEALGIVGESGSGKSLTLRAILGLLPPNGETTGDLRVHTGTGPTGDSESKQVGRDGVAMIFQDPTTALNPTMRVGDLIAEGVRATSRVSSRAAKQRAVKLLQDARVPDPERRARMWPHQLSGGLLQRVMIAAALSREPALLLADEPVTALDVTTQDQILRLLTNLRHERGMTMVFVSHDLAVVAEVCDRVAVMYAGQIIEVGTVAEVLTSPRHPYTAALIDSIPSFHRDVQQLEGISGAPPDPRAFPVGCRFAPRCKFARDDCRRMRPQLIPRPDRLTACIHPEVLRGRACDTTT